MHLFEFNNLFKANSIVKFFHLIDFESFYLLILIIPPYQIIKLNAYSNFHFLLTKFLFGFHFSTINLPSNEL